MNLPFREVWACDFEFHQPDGEQPYPICLVAQELRSGRTLRLRDEQLRARRTSPIPTGPDTLFIGYYSSAELGTSIRHVALFLPSTVQLARYEVLLQGLAGPGEPRPTELRG